MMKRTVVSINKATSLIQKNDKVLTIGSCFSEMIATNLGNNKWTVLSNPFGTIYDPISIARCLQLAIDDTSPDESLFLQREDIHNHYFFHSDLAALSQERLLTQINSTTKRTRDFLKTSNWLIITLGSSIAYQHDSSQTIVANCHKMPNNHFTRVQLSEEEIVTTLRNVIDSIHNVNPRLNIIMTVSPVRHTRQGLSENMVSKSTLRLACETLQSVFIQVSYFPAYEIMLDELRDYQYYEADLIHPNNQAQDHIWTKFSESYMSQESLTFVQKWRKIQQLLHHRALLPESSAHQKFLKTTLQQLMEIASEVDVNKEIELIKNQINDLN
jgi:hypothetical protein